MTLKKNKKINFFLPILIWVVLNILKLVKYLAKRNFQMIISIGKNYYKKDLKKLIAIIEIKSPSIFFYF